MNRCDIFSTTRKENKDVQTSKSTSTLCGTRNVHSGATSLGTPAQSNCSDTKFTALLLIKFNGFSLRHWGVEPIIRVITELTAAVVLDFMFTDVSNVQSWIWKHDECLSKMLSSTKPAQRKLSQHKLCEGGFYDRSVVHMYLINAQNWKLNLLQQLKRFYWSFILENNKL